MNMSPTIGELAKALAIAQGKIEGAAKTSKNPFFGSTYADLASVWDACREPLSSNGLSVIQLPSSRVTENDIEVVVTTILAHASGEWVSEELTAVPVKSDPQGIGSCITYLRRYSLAAVAGVAPEDDDGNAASQPSLAAVATQEPRYAQQACPECGKPDAVIKSKPEYGGGFLCFGKKGGCGAKWQDVNEDTPPAVKTSPVPNAMEIPALREQIKKAMAALNEAGDEPEWTVERTNKLAKEHFNGKIAAKLDAKELSQLADMFSQRLADIRNTTPVDPRQALIIAIRSNFDSPEHEASFLKDAGHTSALDQLTLPVLQEILENVGLPF